MHARKLRLSGLLEATLVAALISLSSPARAEQPVCPSDTGNAEQMERIARKLWEEALKLEESDPRAAIETLSCIQRFADKPAISLRVGLIAERLGNKRLAADSFERYLALAGDAAPDRIEMQERIKKLRAESAPEPKPPPPDKSPPVTPPPPAVPEEKSSPPTLGWIVAGVGGALVIGGGFLLYSAKSHNDEVHDIEPGTTYWNSGEAKDKLDTAKREQTLGFIALGIGAAAVATGVWLILDARNQVAATASVAPGHAGGALRLRF